MDNKEYAGIGTIANLLERIKQKLPEDVSYLMYIENLSIFGTDSYVYNDLPTMLDLFNSKNVVYDKTVRNLVFETGVKNGMPPGIWFAHINDIRDAVDWSKYNTMAAIAASETAMAAIAASETAMAAIAKSYANWNALKDFFITLNANLSYIRLAYNTVTGSSLFALKGTSVQDAITSLNSYGGVDYANNSIIFVATGYYSSASSKTEVYINNQKVSEGTLNNTKKPSSVTESNVGAVAIPVATFKENGDGYAAVSVYTTV